MGPRLLLLPRRLLLLRLLRLRRLLLSLHLLLLLTSRRVLSLRGPLPPPLALRRAPPLRATPRLPLLVGTTRGCCRRWCGG